MQPSREGAPGNKNVIIGGLDSCCCEMRDEEEEGPRVIDGSDGG